MDNHFLKIYEYIGGEVNYLSMGDHIDQQNLQNDVIKDKLIM